MRIISGQYKGRRINPPKNLPVRPTTDMAKEALFNILNNHYYFNEISVLDLFAGTGSISYEFASRGATKITAVDNHYNNIKFINKTAEEFSMQIEALKTDVYQFLAKNKGQYKVIFADPPYAFTDEEFGRIPELIFQNMLLEKNGMLIVEHSKNTDLKEIENYRYSKNYGGSMFSFFHLESEEEE